MPDFGSGCINNSSRLLPEYFSARYFGIYAVIWLAVVLFYVLAIRHISTHTWLSLKSVELPPPNTILAILGLGPSIARWMAR